MSIQDPTVQAIAAYHLSPLEALIGFVVLFTWILFESVLKIIPEDRSPISYQIVRTPKEAFNGVSVEEGHYLYVNYKGQDFRVHYLDKGMIENDRMNEIFCEIKIICISKAMLKYK